jgi:hypothetical protein
MTDAIHHHDADGVYLGAHSPADVCGLCRPKDQRCNCLGCAEARQREAAASVAAHLPSARPLG